MQRKIYARGRVSHVQPRSFLRHACVHKARQNGNATGDRKRKREREKGREGERKNGNVRVNFRARARAVNLREKFSRVPGRVDKNLRKVRDEKFESCPSAGGESQVK